MEARKPRILIFFLCIFIAGFALALAGADPALADTAPAPGVEDLGAVITNIRNWVLGLLVALATLLLTIGGVRYLLAGGDPGEVSKAKDTLKYAALGYGVAILAPLLVEILRGFVGLSS
ncbi:pilin [Salinactinospora qingdaonensis]|uniref:TrbC/VIRB2 family protein n=1 Tax=Salinactinospora qingdaonensis TaxID=702744 RepID=A0ABP7FSE5_9ACTN